MERAYRVEEVFPSWAREERSFLGRDAGESEGVPRETCALAITSFNFSISAIALVDPVDR